MRSQRSQAIVQFGLFCGIVLFINVLASYFYNHLDLTEERRFTLSRPTRELLRGMKDRVYVRVLLEGEFPAGFKRLQTATRDMLDEFRGETGYLDYAFEDPNAGSVEDINERRKAMAEDGIIPVNLRVREEGQSSEKLVYPVAVFHFGSRKIAVKLLENESANLHPNEVINNSVSLLEYKFANAIKKLLTPARPIILFTRGHGELEELQTVDLERTLRQFYDTDRVTLDSVLQIKKDCAVLVVAKPRTSFSEKDKFKIDQYVMNGGKVLWLIDRLGASLDSLRLGNKIFVPSDYPLNLEDMLFKYGVRIQPDLVMDLQCTKIPLVVGQVGNRPQFEPFPWYFHPAVSPTTDHPIVKNLDRVELKFPSSIDLDVRPPAGVKRTVLLESGNNSRLQFSPVELSFELVRTDPNPAKFPKSRVPLAVLMEGSFPSSFQNRVTEDMLGGLNQLGMSYKPLSDPTRMIVVSDGDVAANSIRDREKKSWFPLGYNDFEKATYANKDFVINALEYLIQSDGVIEARSKTVKLRMLDAVKAREQKPMWQAVNLVLPLIFLGLFGWAFRVWRRKKFVK